jgi:hypothetical protein
VSNHYEVGDRFETTDSRDEGRVIEIDEVIHYDQAGWQYDDNGFITEVVTPKVRYRVHSEANPKNPDAVGRRSTISEHGLETRYRKISR